ncbi:MAG: type 2 isopentenyl-diphosphate Delta-isomerase [Bacillota bacterium]|nr:type 2 isopentenyl-diphosphate Delta-isomerase [Bacillota bacterium]
MTYLKKIKTTNSLRQQRKEEHLKMALSLKTGPKCAGFEDVEFVHQALSNHSLDDINTSTCFLGKELKAPFLIEAITGGTLKGKEINKALAKGAFETGIAMAVGSQTIAIEDPSIRETFSVVREYNPHGVILANVSANVPVEIALAAIDMIKADGIQLHLNLAQELLMEEGDRDFRQTGKNIAAIIKDSPVPVIVKEVGFGFSKETVLELWGLGVKLLDLGGAGGTNFAAIENSRRSRPLSTDWYQWGIPTAASILECKATKLPISIIASGGINNGINAAKALALGAHMVGAATPFLKSVEGLSQFNSLNDAINTWRLELEMTMLLVGAKNIQDLRKKPLLLTGATKAWQDSRKLK